MSLRFIRVCVTASLGAALAGCPTTFIDPMEEQKKHVPYDESGEFPDGRAMRPLVEGTVPRERFVGPAEIRTGQSRGASVKTIPIAIDAQLLARGRQRFTIYCAVCHGLLGDGHSVVEGRMALRAPPSLIAGDKATLPPGTIYRAIAEGYGLMPSYAAELPMEERWATIAYLQALKLSQDAPLSLAPPDVRRRLAEEKP